MMRSCLLKIPPLKTNWITQFRGLRGQTENYRKERIVTNADGSVIVCWHPEPKFPYEFTRPVPRVIPTESTLKVQAVEDMKELYHFKNERLVRRDLMRLTWTSKHKWYSIPTSEFKNASRNVPREKPFI